MLCNQGVRENGLATNQKVGCSNHSGRTNSNQRRSTTTTGDRALPARVNSIWAPQLGEVRDAGREQPRPAQNLFVLVAHRDARPGKFRKRIFVQTLHCDMFVTAVGWTVKWTASILVGNQNSPARLLSTLLSISRSKRMVLDGRNRRNRMAAGRAKSF